jgi:hypothetical protein
MKRRGWEVAALGVLLGACSGKTVTDAEALGGRMSGGGSGNGGSPARGGSSDSGGATSTGGAPLPVAGSDAYGGRGSTNSGGTATTPEAPAPADDSACSDGVCSFVLQGSVADVKLDHGFWQASVAIADGQQYFAVDGALGQDGFLFATTSYDGSTRSAQLAGGIFRLPSSVAGRDRSWFCINAGKASILHERLTRLDITAISRLGAATDSQPGADSLTTTLPLPEAYSSPLDDDGSVSFISAYSDQSGAAFYQLLLPAGDASFASPWRVLGFESVPRRASVDDLVLLNYGTAAAQLAFPAAGSTLVVGDDDDTVVLDLRNIAAPVACPGEAVDGSLSIYIDSDLK